MSERLQRMFVLGAPRIDSRWTRAVDAAAPIWEQRIARLASADAAASLSSVGSGVRYERLVGDEIPVSAAAVLAAEREIAYLKAMLDERPDHAMWQIREVVARVMAERDEARMARGRWQDDGGRA